MEVFVGFCAKEAHGFPEPVQQSMEHQLPLLVFRNMELTRSRLAWERSVCSGFGKQGAFACRSGHRTRWQVARGSKRRERFASRSARNSLWIISGFEGHTSPHMGGRR